jgi:hypothetical protein
VVVLVHGRDEAVARHPHQTSVDQAGQRGLGGPAGTGGEEADLFRGQLRQVCGRRCAHRIPPQLLELLQLLLLLQLELLQLLLLLEQLLEPLQLELPQLVLEQLLLEQVDELPQVSWL